MPHSLSPTSTLVDVTGTSATVSQVESTQPEDVAMEDSPQTADAAHDKADLEALFDDADSDKEFGSSAPQAKEEGEELSQPAPMCAISPFKIREN